MNLPVYLSLLSQSEKTLADSFRVVAEAHGDEPDIHFLCMSLADQCEEHQAKLQPVIERYGEGSDDEPERLHAAGVGEARTGPLGMLRDLQDLYLLASLTDITWIAVEQAGQALRDRELLEVVSACDKQTAVQLRWLKTRMKHAAPQVLIAAS
ncbi:hypothetical protein G5T42_03790 [Microbacterium sp. 4R-513]|uniref:hypothetical protein n=1 Tax=Microbacterium sp. 4R-513 TaxID=2567934 RepID=UPI0013E12384|nr:hypothetical protein [Microbacterium sp. 4R-513]QIG38717.1 hypothetical protein G5T42_03790 [Microbacterium sp. 4R-513]